MTTSGRSKGPTAEFEYKCTNKACRHVQWVKGTFLKNRGMHGSYILGSRADFCDECQKQTMKHTGTRRTTSPPSKSVIEVVEQVKTFDVHGHTWSCGVSHSLWERGQTAENVGHSGVWPLENSARCLGPGGRIRVTMKVEVLKAGKEQERFHKQVGVKCRSCRTNTAAPGKMHIIDGHIRDGILCGKFKDIQPSEWPSGNDYVKSGDAGRATCRQCLKKWKSMEDKRRRDLREAT